MSRTIDPVAQHAGRPALMAALARKAADAVAEEARMMAWLNRDPEAIRNEQRMARRAARKAQ